MRADEGEFQPFGELFKEAQNGVRARERERFYDLGEIEILSHNDAQAPRSRFVHFDARARAERTAVDAVHKIGNAQKAAPLGDDGGLAADTARVRIASADDGAAQRLGAHGDRLEKGSLPLEFAFIAHFPQRRERKTHDIRPRFLPDRIEPAARDKTNAHGIPPSIVLHSERRCAGKRGRRKRRRRKTTQKKNFLAESGENYLTHGE